MVVGLPHRLCRQRMKTTWRC